MKKLLFVALATLLLAAVAAAAAEGTLEDRVKELEAKAAKVKALEAELAKLKALEPRLTKVEKEEALDRVKLTGDFRFEVHSIQSAMPASYDGMALQNLTVGTMFYFLRHFDGEDPLTGFPPSVTEIRNEVRGHFGDWLAFTNGLTFDQLKQFMGGFAPEQQQMLMALLMPAAARAGYDWNNDVLYTSRLRLQMDAEVAGNIRFAGRLAMYKPWGDSSGVQVLNGQSNSLNIDGTTATVPNSDILRVERAYFDWRDIGGLPVYLSFGRRPSTGGPPLHLRQDEPRGGTPAGSIINFQFDGITAGWHLTEQSTFRVCYGLGYESGFGNGEQLKLPADRLKDVHFLGFNWDLWNTEQMFVQTTVARAYDVTDGFNGLVVLPGNPLTGESVGAPVVMRYTPSANLGNINIGSLVLMRRDGPLDWFASASLCGSQPYQRTTPFGGLFCDPFDTPQKHSGSMVYAGARWSLPNEQTKVGVEYNHGSQYWFNFANGEDDIIGAKTDTRGDVWEAYVTHRVARRFIAKLDYMRYDYDYSGSGWHVGAPKKLSDTPILGFPTYDTVDKVALSLTARF